MLTDPVADMLTRIRNANKALHDRVEMPTSKLKEEIARILKEEGYVRDYHVVETDLPYKVLVIDLKYGRSRERGSPSRAGASMPARTGCRASSAAWALRSCRRRAASSRAVPPSGRASAAR